MTKLEDYYRNKVSAEAYDFFAVFSRFEYAMKFSSLRQEKKPEASWHKLAEALTESFYQAMREAPEAAIYFENPPMQLKLKNKKVVFEKETAPKDSKDLFMALKRARNNLFHGDKQHDSQRDTDLMIAGLYILNRAFEVAEAAKGNTELEQFIGLMEFNL